MSAAAGPFEADAVNRIAAALRAQAEDLSLYAGLLLDALAGALPPELVRVERKRRRLRTGDGPIVAVTVTLGDWRFGLRRDAVGAAAVSDVQHVVRGIVLSSGPLPLLPWSQRLAEELARLAATSAAAAAALERFAAPSFNA